MRPNDRRGFSFTEVLFAVIILGIGLILVAAIFPVSLSQTRLTVDESIASTSARGGNNAMARVFENSDRMMAVPLLPATGNATSRVGMISQLPPDAWNTIRGNLIIPETPNRAWVPLYRRNGNAADATRANWDPFAQIILIPVVMRNQTMFDAASTDPATGTHANLQPRPVEVEIQNNPANDGIDLITITDGSLAGASNAAVEGAYVIIANDMITSPPDNAGLMNGRIYRLSLNRGGGVFELMPGYDFNPDPGADGNVATAADNITGIGPNAEAFIVGRGFVDNSITPAGADGYVGPAMDTGVYTSWIKCN